MKKILIAIIILTTIILAGCSTQQETPIKPVPVVNKKISLEYNELVITPGTTKELKYTVGNTENEAIKYKVELVKGKILSGDAEDIYCSKDESFYRLEPGKTQTNSIKCTANKKVLFLYSINLINLILDDIYATESFFVKVE